MSSLDDKIELNRQMNATLESIAQVLFKSWFVDFDPVIDNALAAGNPIPEALKAKAATRQALGEKRKPLPETIHQKFPSSFKFSEEMGWIPEAWVVNAIADLIIRQSVGRKYSQKTAQDAGIVPILDQGKSGIIGYHNDIPGVKACTDDPVIVFANHTCYMKMVMHDFSAIQNVLPFKGRTSNIYWLYYATLGKQTFSEYKGHWPDFVLHKIVRPKSCLDNVFGEIVAAQMIAAFKNDAQNLALSKLRDTLLPKLLSGELRIPDAEKLMANSL